MRHRMMGAAAVVAAAVALAACARTDKEMKYTPPRFEDGSYRGVFIDKDEIQVNIEFSLEDNRVTGIRYRHLRAEGREYLKADDGTREARLRDEYRKLVEYLIGKDIRMHLADLYRPETIAADVDGLSAATMRSSKMISAIRDGLNRGVYSYPK